jgi:hypothetical protein
MKEQEKNEPNEATSKASRTLSGSRTGLGALNDDVGIHRVLFKMFTVIRISIAINSTFAA